MAPEMSVCSGEQTKLRRSEIPWKQIAGMRHKVIHDYFRVNLERRFWRTLERRLTDLVVTKNSPGRA
jgi:uncharacterized protein with HEPN domain